MNKTLNKHWPVYICTGLILVTLIVFEPVRRNGFVSYDDNTYVTENPHVIKGLNPQSIIWAFTTTHAGNWHPLTWLSHMLDCELFGLNPLWHHLVNLLFHIANTLLLFWVLKKMTGALWPGAFVAAAFAVHPLHVESVAWIAERKDVLSSLFWFLTIAAYIRYAERPGVAKFLLVILAFLLGLMAKPMLVTLPFVLLLLDYWPLRRFESVQINCRISPTLYLLVEKLPLFILAAVSCVITYIVQQSTGALKLTETLPLNIRLSNALVSYSGYIVKMVYPSRLAVLYPLGANGLPSWQPAASLLVLIVVSVGIIYTARRRPYLVVGWLWYLGTLVPVIGLVQVGSQSMADRYTYLPSIGIFIIIAFGAAELLAKWRYRKIASAVLGGGVIVVMVICTRIQLRYWRNDLTLYERALAVTRNNFIIHHNYGYALFKHGRPDKAIIYYKEALQIMPDCTDARSGLGYVLARLGRVDEAVNEYRQVLEILPDSPQAHNDLGTALGKQGKFNEAIEHFNEAVKIKPDFADAHRNLGFALTRQGKFTEAITHLAKAVQLNPDSALIHFFLASALADVGKTDEARLHFKEALRIDPNLTGVPQSLKRNLQHQIGLDRNDAPVKENEP